MQTLDNFTDLSVWLPIASGRARLELAPTTAPAGQALQLNFDFAGGGGFVVARRELALTLPASYALLLDVRATAPANAFEFKVIDPSGVNVWRYRDDAFAFNSTWHTLRIPSSALAFGWGPAGGGVAAEVGAIELVIAAGPGGCGELAVANLRLEDRTPTALPLLCASTAQPAQDAGCAMDGNPATCWRAAQLPADLDIDFHEERDYGGLILRWDTPNARQFALYASTDGTSWRSLYVAPQAAGHCNAVYLPGGSSRFLRLTLDAPANAPIPGVIAVEMQPEAFARSINDFFHRLAADAPRGRYPRWLYREQSYWTPVDVPNGAVPALFNEEGMVEMRRAGFAVEPFLTVVGAAQSTLITWADCTIQPALLQPPLPIPQTVWHWRDPAGAGTVQLTITASASTAAEATWFRLSYCVENQSDVPLTVRLNVALRPFQVSPPWQSWRDIGGVSPIREIAYRNGAVWVNGALALLPLTTPSGFGAAAFDAGAITEALANGTLPAAHAVSDPFGYASAALAFEVVLAAGASSEIVVIAPGDDRCQLAGGRWQPEMESDPLAAAREQWALALGAVQFTLPPVAQDYLDASMGSLAHILITRNGAALQPGARRYTRSWIRDGAGMVAALLRFGRPHDAENFIRWYAPFQAADGNVPCCVDAEGADWLPEHDSHGQLIFTIAEHYRFTGDRRLVADLWPAVRRAVAYLEQLRAQRLTVHYRTGEHRACFGLLPESVSHEGYLAHPVHSYWDDFWALRGFKDAVVLAQVMGDTVAAEHFIALRDDFNTTLHTSLACTMTERGIDFLPGSVEWADPDPTATANALTLIDDLQQLPVAVLNRSFDLFMERFRAMHGAEPVAWTNYTPYEIRIIGALVRLGRRDDAHELAHFFLAERRPPVWNQWPEIAWRDARTPGHQGDLPHTWIGAEYCLAFRDLFVYERESDQALVIGAGIPAAWLDAGEITVTALPTAYGTLDLQFRRAPNGHIAVHLGGEFRVPPGGIHLALPTQ